MEGCQLCNFQQDKKVHHPAAGNISNIEFGFRVRNTYFVDSNNAIYLITGDYGEDKLLRFNHLPLVPIIDATKVDVIFNSKYDNLDKPKTIHVKNIGTADLLIKNIETPS